MIFNPFVFPDMRNNISKEFVLIEVRIRTLVESVQAEVPKTASLIALGYIGAVIAIGILLIVENETPQTSRFDDMI